MGLVVRPARGMLSTSTFVAFAAGDAAPFGRTLNTISFSFCCWRNCCLALWFLLTSAQGLAAKG